MSGAVVVFAVFILPHDAPAAVRPGAAPSPRASHVTGSTGASTHDPTTTTTSPGAASLLTPSILLPSGTSGLPSSGIGASAEPRVAQLRRPRRPLSQHPSLLRRPRRRPTYVPPHVGSQSWPGNLGAPYTSASYQLSTTGGEVSAQATWSGTPTLTLEVTCGSATKSLSGSSGLYVAVDAGAGSCTITLSEPAGVSVAVSYTLTASYPTS